MSAAATKLALEVSMQESALIVASLGNPIRLYDAPIKQAAFPFAFWRRWESKPVAADYETAQEHIATIEVHCRNVGLTEAKAAVEAIQAWAANAKPVSDDVRITLLICSYADVFRAIDGRTFLGVVRLKIITEKL